MNNKYKLLTYVESPSPNKTPYRDRFAKLTLGSSTKSKNSRKSLGVDVRFNQSLLTDDESDNDDPALPDVEKHRLIQKILDSNYDDEDEDPVPSEANGRFEISQKLEFSDSDETNCTDDNLTNENEIGKNNEIEKSSTPLFSKASSSCEEIAKNSCKLKTDSADTVVSRLSTQFDRLDLIDGNDNISDDIKIRNSLLIKNLNESVKNMIANDNQGNIKIENDMNTVLTISSASENDVADETSSDCSEDYESASSGKRSVILISDSDDDENKSDSNSRYENHVSNTQSSKDTVSESVIRKLNDFFNNIPSLPTTPRQDSLCMDVSFHDVIPATPKKSSHSINSENEVVIPETPEHSIKSMEIASEIISPKNLLNTNIEQLDNNKSKSLHSENNSIINESDMTEINISAKIQINIQISEIEHQSDASNISDYQNEDINDNVDIQQDDKNENSLETTKSSLKLDDFENTASFMNKCPSPKASLPPSNNISDPKISKEMDDTVLNTPEKEENTALNTSEQEENDKFSHLNQSNFEIDDDMEKILNDLYGNKWKTPQLLQKCSSKKCKTVPKMNRVLDDGENAVKKIQSSRVSEPVDVTDFSMFHKNIPENFESTRIDSSKKPVKTNTVTKQPKSTDKVLQQKDARKHLNFAQSPYQQRVRRKAAENVKKLIAIVDSESSSDDDNDFKASDSDDSFKANSSSDSSTSEEKSSSDDENVSKPKNQPKGKRGNTNKITSNPKPRKSLFGMETIETIDSESENSSSDNDENDNNNDECEGDEISKNKSNENMPPPNLNIPVPTQKRKLFNPNDYLRFDDSEIVEDPKEKDIPLLNVNVIDFSPRQFLKKPQNKTILDLKNSGKEKITIKTPAKDKIIPKSSKKTTKHQTLEPIENPHKKYGFLESLDEKVSKFFCHHDALQYRENFQKTKMNLCDVLYKMYNESIFKFNDDIKVPITWNKRLINTAGRCMTSKKKGIRSCRIELSEKVLTNPGRLRCTLIHELCHAATWLYDEVNGHGPHWKSWVTKSMNKFPELPPISVCHSYEIEYKYTYRCVQCHAKSQAHSKSKKVEGIRCRMCHGAIEILLNKRDKDGHVIHTPIRKPTAFANYVKENYPKGSNTPHGDIMRKLGADFKNLSMTSKSKY